MTFETDRSRRKFLMGLAKTGMLLPFAGQLLGQSVFAAGTAQRVLFMYYPNGAPPDTWNPVQTSGTINTTNELSFGLGPLKAWHNKMIVLRNVTIDGSAGGSHKEETRGLLTGNSTISAGSASIDHLIAQRLGTQGVLSLGVRTGRDSSMMVSKPFNVDTLQRPIPNNNPYDVANKLSSRIGGSSVSSLQTSIFTTVLTDFDDLASATLESASKTKVDQHAAALRRLKDQAGSQVGECGFVIPPALLAADNTDGTTTLNESEFQRFPDLARAQVDNIVGAFGCGLHKVATLQLAKGDENTGQANYAFDECWAMNQLLTGYGTPPTRWYNEHSSHSASHKPTSTPIHAQVRWYHSLLAYTLQQLSAKGLLDDTLVVLCSETGDGAVHNKFAGAMTVAGGAGGSLQMGRVISCGDGQGRTFGTQNLFGDIARLMGVTGLQEPYWTGGILT